MNAKKAFVIFKPNEIVIEEHFPNVLHIHIYFVYMCVYPPKYTSYVMKKLKTVP